MLHCNVTSVLDACIICSLNWIYKIILVHLFTKYVLGLLMCAFKVLMKDNQRIFTLALTKFSYFILLSKEIKTLIAIFFFP